VPALVPKLLLGNAVLEAPASSPVSRSYDLHSSHAPAWEFSTQRSSVAKHRLPAKNIYARTGSVTLERLKLHSHAGAWER